jgi:NNP family nitrate/nitrite transporter-like MFS transporter
MEELKIKRTELKENYKSASLKDYSSRLVWIGFFSIPPLINEIKESFAISNAEVGLLIAIPSIAFVVFSIFIGIFVDKWGSYKSSLISLCLMGILGILKGLSVNYFQFFILTSIQSASTGMASGIIFVFFLTPLIKIYWKWIIIFYSFIPLLILIIYLNNRSLLESSDRLIEKHFGFSSLIIKDWRVYYVGLFYFVTTLTYFGLTSWLPQYLQQEEFLFQPSWASALMIFTGIFSAIFIPFIFDRIKNKMFFVKLIVIGLGLSVYCLIKVPGIYKIFIIALLGIFNGPVRPMLNTLAIDLVKKGQEIGKITGLLLTLANIGGFLGAWLIGLIKDSTQSFNYGFILLTFFLVIAAIIPIKLRNEKI